VFLRIGSVPLFILAAVLNAGEPVDKFSWISEEIAPLNVITVKASDGQTTVAVIRKPPGKGPFPAVIILHGGLVRISLDRLKDASLNTPAYSRLLAAGYITVTPTFRDRQQDPQTTGALTDCLAVVEHVRKMPDVGRDSIFLLGGSGGGSLVLEIVGETDVAAAAAGEPATVLFTGMFTNKHSREELNTIMREPQRFFTVDLQRFTREKINKIRAPILILHGDVHPLKKLNNEIVIPELLAAGKRLDLSYHPGAPHGFYFGAGPKEATWHAHEAVKSFFARYQKTPPSPIAATLIQWKPFPARRAADQ